jgi:hypothetical protein
MRVSLPVKHWISCCPCKVAIGPSCSQILSASMERITAASLPFATHASERTGYSPSRLEERSCGSAKKATLWFKSAIVSSTTFNCDALLRRGMVAQSARQRRRLGRSNLVRIQRLDLGYHSLTPAFALRDYIGRKLPLKGEVLGINRMEERFNSGRDCDQWFARTPQLRV